LESRRLLSSIPLPTIPAGTFLVTSYGATGDGVTNDTTAIQDAINAAIAAGGGTVEITAATGAYECGPITLGSNIDLQIDSGAELQALPYTDYPGAGGTTISNFIQASNDTNVEISGSGTIDGNGAAWWAAYESDESIKRPDLLRFNDDNTVLVEGITLQNSPTENIAFGATDNVTINGITINSPATSPNTDGIDPAGSNYLIENCNISDGDDDIAIKPQNVYCSNITIENCTIGTGHGISVGGETNDGLDGLTVTNVTFNGTTNGIRLKADRGNGGVVENLSYSDITMTNVEYPILIDSYYNGSNDIPTDPAADPGQTYVAGSTPLWENISISKLTSTNSASNSNAGIIFGLPEAPVENLSFTNVKITANIGMEIDHVRNLTFNSTSQITAASGNDLFGSTTSTSAYPSPYDATIVGAGFVNEDIGSPTVPTGTSSSLYDPDTNQWTIQGDGAGLGSSGDQFNFSYVPITGNGGIEAQLTSLSNPGAGAVPAAGVMIRSSTDADDPFAAVVQTTAGKIVFQWRTTAGGTLHTSAAVSRGIGSMYLKVVRSGDSYSGYFSTDGMHWRQIGPTVTITAIGATANAGLAVTSDSDGNLATAVFANVEEPVHRRHVHRICAERRPEWVERYGCGADGSGRRPC
jgi:polygalacturonase